MLVQAVAAALDRAYQGAAELSPAQRSAAWVSALADALCKTCAVDRDVVAFCRGNARNRPDFRMNEILFDVLVAETRRVQSVRGKPLQAVSKALWVVESELKRTDSRDVLIDLNKLIVAQAVNKVLVISEATSLVDWSKKMMSLLLDPKESNIFLVTIPHPQNWLEPSSQRSAVYQMMCDADWRTLSSSEHR